MLETLITSKTRIKLMLKFFLNPNSEGYLRSLAEEFGESTNSVRLELNRFADAGLLSSEEVGRTKVYKANKNHPLFPDIQNIVKKYLGIDQLIDKILSKLGKVELAFIAGDYAKGIDSGTIELVIVGDIDKEYMDKLVEKAEKLVKREITYTYFNKEDFDNKENQTDTEEMLLVYKDND